MIKFLNRPYPFSFQHQRRIKQIIPISIALYVFFILFKPMGTDNNPNYLIDTAVAISIGAVIALITTVIIPYYTQGFFNESKWTLKRNLIWSGNMMILFILLGYFPMSLYFNISITWNHFKGFSFLQLILLIPLGLIVNLMNQYYLLRRHVNIADGLNPIQQKEGQSNANLAPLELDVDIYTKLKVEILQIVYVEALGNYVNIVYDDGKIKKATIRESLGNVEQKIIAANAIYKSHRSYLVNLNYVYAVSGDAQGLKIHFKDIDNIIPVSRNSVKEFRTLISSLK